MFEYLGRRNSVLLFEVLLFEELKFDVVQTGALVRIHHVPICHINVLEHIGQIAAGQTDSQFFGLLRQVLGAQLLPERHVHAGRTDVGRCGHDDLAQTRYTQSDVHLTTTGKMERVQSHLSRWLTDRLCGQQANCFARLTMRSKIVRVDCLSEFAFRDRRMLSGLFFAVILVLESRLRDQLLAIIVDVVVDQTVHLFGEYAIVAGRIELEAGRVRSACVQISIFVSVFLRNGKPFVLDCLEVYRKLVLAKIVALLFSHFGQLLLIERRVAGSAIRSLIDHFFGGRHVVYLLPFMQILDVLLDLIGSRIVLQNFQLVLAWLQAIDVLRNQRKAFRFEELGFQNVQTIFAVQKLHHTLIRIAHRTVVVHHQTFQVFD